MKIKVSYSMLAAWAKGDYDSAINMYLGNWPEPSEAMLEGRKLHEQWKTEIETTGCLPKVFGGQKVTNPIVETKYRIMLNDWIELVGIVDEEDDVIGRDWKSGTTPAGNYTRSYQHKIYQLLRPKLKRFEYHAYNQYTEEVTMSIVHLTDKTMREGAEWVLTYASEMRDYIETNNLERQPENVDDKLTELELEDAAVEIEAVV